MTIKKISAKLNILLNESKHNEARKFIFDTIEKCAVKKTKLNFLKTAELYGCLIDLGCDSGNEDDLKKAIKFLEECEVTIGKYINKQSFYYNLANAYHGLARIYWHKNPGVPTLKFVSDKLQPAINFYWLAYKNLKADDSHDLKHQILINSANSLKDCGRMIECVQFLDQVLKENSSFPQALISKGDAIHTISRITNCAYSGSLFFEVYKSYDAGINTGALPTAMLALYSNYREGAKKVLDKMGFSIDKLSENDSGTFAEFEKHSEYRKYCLNNFISLNEHAVYCGCVSATYDDLQIGVQHAIFKGEMVPKLELLLNRIKSEFSLARWLYYHSQIEAGKLDKSTLYSELLDGEVIGTEAEMLRTSYRTCYGILDKIALGICKFYNLSAKREPVYFERFWNDKKPRWEKLNQIKNIHLNALFSIARDLNSETGELKHFKKWRNKLEHKVLVLKEVNDTNIDVLKLFGDDDFIDVVSEKEFREKTLHLLQLTRAAIFSFVYCIRLETIQKPDKSKQGFVVKFK